MNYDAFIDGCDFCDALFNGKSFEENFDNEMRPYECTEAELRTCKEIYKNNYLKYKNAKNLLQQVFKNHFDNLASDIRCLILEKRLSENAFDDFDLNGILSKLFENFGDDCRNEIYSKGTISEN